MSKLIDSWKTNETETAILQLNLMKPEQTEPLSQQRAVKIEEGANKVRKEKEVQINWRINDKQTAETIRKGSVKKGWFENWVRNYF